jgi:hypothetical protein
MFLHDANIVVENTTNPGQLLSVTDSTPYHVTGTTYLDRATGKAYVYAYNAHTATLTAHAPSFVAAYNNVGNVFDGVQSLTTVTDIGENPCYVCSNVAAIPTLYYGWFQYRGNETALSGCTSEARTAGDNMVVTASVLSRAAAPAWGVDKKCFAIVRVANTAAGTTANVFLIGRECIPGT